VSDYDTNADPLDPDWAAARIAEMEAELARRPFYPKTQTQYFDVVHRAEKAEAELAVLKAQRCETCDHNNGTEGWGHIICAEGVDEAQPGFSCNRWAERITP